MKVEIKDKFHPDHWADLKKSGLSDKMIQAAGLYSVRPTDIQQILGFNPPKVDSALAFPYNSYEFVRLKVFPSYSDKEGKKVKYLQKKGSGVHLYIPPGIESTITDTSIPIYLTEGEKKTLKAVQEGFCCVGIGGVWNWKESGKDGVIPDIKNLLLSGRQVFIVPDSDFIYNSNVRQAVYCLGVELRKLGAYVEVVCLMNP